MSSTSKSADLPVAASQSANGSPSSQATTADLFSVILQGIPSLDDSVYLVSRDGKKFAIHEKVLKDSSDFFKAALENNMRESGKYLDGHTVRRCSLKYIMPDVNLKCIDL
jgi:hypothetical protein